MPAKQTARKKRSSHARSKQKRWSIRRLIVVTRNWLILMIACPLLGAWAFNGHTPRDWFLLTQGLYFEGAVNESFVGLWGIASNINNRVISVEYPDSIYLVVTEGDRGQTNGGCQYSYRCDIVEPDWWYRSIGQVEARDREIRHFWGFDHSIGYEFRWASYASFALFHMSVGQWLWDPTDRSALYWTGRDPYWVTDCVSGSIERIGNHNFCQSIGRGDDLWR